MQIYIGERQSGKTTMLIEMSEKTGATIVVATYPMANYIQLLAAQMGKKIPVFQGHELDTAHMAKELGDVAWYLAVSANAIGYDLETIMQMNVDKLKARYPDGFDAEHSLHRDQDDI